MHSNIMFEINYIITVFTVILFDRSACVYNGIINENIIKMKKLVETSI